MAPPKSKSTKKASETGTERLDVEEDDARQKRLQTLLEHLSTPSTHPATTAPAFPAPPTGLPKFDFGDRRTEAVVPNTELLSRVQAFLPQLEASNRELLARAKTDPKSVDIENVETKDGRVIEMNLGLGVFESKEPQGRKSGKAGKRDTTNTLSGDAPPSTKRGSDKDDEEMDSSSSLSSSSSDDSDSDSSEDDSDSDSSSTSSSSTSSPSSSSRAEDQGPNDPLTNFFASLGSALDSATSSSLHSDSGSDSEDSDGEGEDEDPLTTFFDSLRYGQTISVDSSEEEGEGGDGSSSDSDEGGDGERRNEERKEEKEKREVKPLPERARPRIEVIGGEALVEVKAGEVGGA